MGKTWSNNKRDLRDLNSWLSKGSVIYYINNHATNLTGVFDVQTYSDAVCTGKNWVTGAWMFGPVSAQSLLFEYKKIFTSPPPGIRYLGGPEPDCRGEDYRVGRGQMYGGQLNLDTIDAMERHAQDATDERDKRAAQRGNKKGWF